MSVLDAFFLNWRKARDTFGAGTPQTGEQFDHSALFRELEARLETTAPGDQWSGTAADAYDAVNTEHRRVIGELANLDQRLGAEVTRSAQIVTAGRTDLQTVHDAVAAVADRLPTGPSGDAMRYALVSQGTGQVNEIIRRSSSELSTVGANLLVLNDEYAALGNQKFGGLKENDPQDPLWGEDEDDEANQERDADRQRNQINAFRQVFGREPVSTADWKTAAALDPHSYDAKFRGVPPEIQVARIDPAPSQGVVRISQWIEQRDVFGWPDIADTSKLPPPLRHLGNDRLPDVSFDPEDTKVTTYVDYENGLVIMRQNPTVEQLPDGSPGDVKVGTPSASVTQLPDGSVRISYDAGNPFVPEILMDPDGPLGGNQPSVNGDLVFTPGPDGVRIDGTRTDYPSMEVYQDFPGGSTRTVLIDPAQSGSSTGPMLNLPFHHDIGAGPEAFEPFDTGDWNPRYDVRIPLPATEFGPVTSPPSAAPAPPPGVTRV